MVYEAGDYGQARGLRSPSGRLRVATVYVSVLGNARKKRATLAGLEAAHGLLQGRLARQLRMKRTPQLTFEYDPSVERGVRMTQLIDELAPDDDAADD